MIEFVTSSGMNRVSALPAPATPSPRRPSSRPAPPGPVGVGVLDGWNCDCDGKPGSRGVLVPPGPDKGCDGCCGDDPEPRPKMASIVAARSRAFVFSQK